MSRPIIEVEGLSKRYKLGEFNARTLRDQANVFLRRMSGNGRAPRELDLWALRDVSFLVEPGEVVGIIGRNGAGKSTLLKILSRITEPTGGEVRLRGRVASLLEVGTGFHPELTGRENIYLNGAILGLRKAEVRKKFDQIVAFAETERFLDTPVKRYSSGMYVRLAFAVAAHLEPDILIVDEVLAVGDASFQKKCLSKMREAAATDTRTVLFVSHNMAAIRALCGRALLLEAGRIARCGDPDTVVTDYLNVAGNDTSRIRILPGHPRRLPKMTPIINEVYFTDIHGCDRSTFTMSESPALSMAYDSVGTGIALAGAGFILEHVSGARVGAFNTYMGTAPPHRIPDRGIVRFVVRAPTLTPGRYLVSVSIGNHQSHLADKIEHVASFDVVPDDIYKTGYILTQEDGVVALDCGVTIVSPVESLSAPAS